jgi:hypothetical protein
LPNFSGNEHEVDFGHMRKATAASWSLIFDGILKTSEYSGVMVSEIIIGSNKIIRLRDRLRKKCFQIWEGKWYFKI